MLKQNGIAVFSQESGANVAMHGAEIYGVDIYIVVMTDGDEAILEKDRTGKDGKLKICKDKYMKVDCKNRLLEKKKYRRASGDGE